MDAAADADALPDASGSVDAAAVDGGVPPDVPVPPPVPVGRVVGRVLGRGTRSPIVGASVGTSTGEPVDSDAHGNFELMVPCGTQRVTVEAAGFELLLTYVEVCGRESAASITLRLTPNGSGATHETVVRSKPSHPAVRLTKEELTQTAGALGDPFRALESLPGVTTVAWPAPIYAIRGSNPGNTGFFLDGVRVPALFHLALDRR